MNHQLQSNDANQLSELSSGAKDVILKSEEIEIAKRYDEPISRHGVKVRKVITTKLVPRRTFIKGTFKGKYWGEYESGETLLKDAGQFYNITLYESEIFIDREVIRTEDSITFPDFLAGISETNSFTSYHHVDPSQLKNNVLVVNHDGNVSRYKIDLHEPRLYNTKIVHALHQSSDQEVFGSIESNICGYLLDKKEVTEESYEEVEDIPNTPIPPVPPTSPIIPALDDAREPKGNISAYLNTSDQELHKNKTIEQPTRWRDKWWLLPLVLIFLLCLLAFASPSNNSLWILLIAALLFFAFQKSSFRLPNWVYAILFLFIGLMLWNAFKPSPRIPDVATDVVHKNIDDEAKKDKQTVIDGNSAGKPKENVENKTAANTSVEPANIESIGSVGTKEVPPSISPKNVIKKEVSEPTKTVDKSIPATPNVNRSTFDSYISKGIKAVEDEEYVLANENFRQAFRISPQNPRLTELANKFKKTAEQKCQEIKSANAKNLAHIPNNYYQYAASLTQTVPLKCE
jgi:hypothetical protein